MKKLMNRWKRNFEYKYSFLKILNSPFVLPEVSIYFGKIRMGTPYFLPRRWVKFNKQDCINSCLEEKEVFAKLNKPFYKTWKDYKGARKAVYTKLFNIQFITLGWKTKWDDYRFEWAPMLSIVFLYRQLVISLRNKYEDSYWEGWLYYHYRTNKSLSTKERLIELFNQFSCTWIRYEGDNQIKTDYYPFILKKKYLDIYNEWLTSKNK